MSFRPAPWTNLQFVPVSYTLDMVFTLFFVGVFLHCITLYSGRALNVLCLKVMNGFRACTSFMLGDNQVLAPRPTPDGDLYVYLDTPFESYLE